MLSICNLNMFFNYAGFYTLLQLSSIDKVYGAAERPVRALRDVSLSVAKGEFGAILGPSGSGKSTLLNVIGMLERPDRGRLRIAGVDIETASREERARLRNRLVGFVFQSFQLLPRLTAWQNVALPLLYRGAPRRERRAPALAMLERVGLSDRADHLPNALSGGQRQRVALARALIGAPQLVLADEPTGSLDSVTAREAMDLLRSLNRRLGVTMLIVTHDRALADRCDRRIEILDGRIVSDTGRAAGTPRP